MCEAPGNKKDATSEQLNRRLLDGDYEFFLAMARQKDSLPDIRQTAKDMLDMAVVLAILDSSGRKALHRLLKIAHDRQLPKDCRIFARAEAEVLVSEEIKRCVSNGWYAALIEMEKMKLPKDSKKAVRAAIGSAAEKAIGQYAAANCRERLLEMSKNNSLDRKIRELAEKTAERLSSGQDCSALKKDDMVSRQGFMRDMKRREEIKNFAGRLRRTLRL